MGVKPPLPDACRTAPTDTPGGAGDTDSDSRRRAAVSGAHGLSTRAEIGRKAIHMGVSLAAAALVLLLPPSAARFLFVGVALMAVAADFARRRPPLDTAFRHLFGRWLRPSERARLTGATTLALGFAAAVLVFPGPFAAIGILFAGIADAFAALVGRAAGRRRLPGGKSLEGSLAFFGTALLIGWLSPVVGTAAAFAAAAAATLVEAAPLDDNVLLPPVGAALVWAASVLLP